MKIYENDLWEHLLPKLPAKCSEHLFSTATSYHHPSEFDLPLSQWSIHQQTVEEWLHQKH